MTVYLFAIVYLCSLLDARSPDCDDLLAIAKMGTLPLALGLGAGAQACRPFGIAIVGPKAVVTNCDAVFKTGSLHLYGSAAARRWQKEAVSGFFPAENGVFKLILQFFNLNSSDTLGENG